MQRHYRPAATPAATSPARVSASVCNNDMGEGIALFMTLMMSTVALCLVGIAAPVVAAVLAGLLTAAITAYLLASRTCAVRVGKNHVARLRTADDSPARCERAAAAVGVREAVDALPEARELHASCYDLAAAHARELDRAGRAANLTGHRRDSLVDEDTGLTSYYASDLTTTARRGYDDALAEAAQVCARLDADLQALHDLADALEATASAVSGARAAELRLPSDRPRLAVEARISELARTEAYAAQVQRELQEQYPIT